MLRKKRERSTIGRDVNVSDKRCAAAPDDVWTWDCMQGGLESGQAVKCLSIVDEFTRECLELRVEWSLTGEDVLGSFDRLIGQRKAPRHVRAGTAVPLMAEEVEKWTQRSDGAILFIAPGGPWQDGYTDLFQDRLREDLAALNHVHTLNEAKSLAQCWMEDYNTKWLHSSLGYLPPAEFAIRFSNSVSTTRRSDSPRYTRLRRRLQGVG